MHRGALLLYGAAALLALAPCWVSFPEERWNPESPLLAPRVLLALLCRNSERSLPHVLGAIDRLHYPKDRIAVW
ncbi:procollagen galactosyltransferase 1 isoform X1 [Tachysurus ichikawai]